MRPPVTQAELPKRRQPRHLVGNLGPALHFARDRIDIVQSDTVAARLHPAVDREGELAVGPTAPGAISVSLRYSLTVAPGAACPDTNRRPPSSASMAAMRTAGRGPVAGVTGVVAGSATPAIRGDPTRSVARVDTEVER